LFGGGARWGWVPSSDHNDGVVHAQVILLPFITIVKTGMQLRTSSGCRLLTLGDEVGLPEIFNGPIVNLSKLTIASLLAAQRYV